VGDYRSGNDSAASIGYKTMLLSGKLSVRDVVSMIVIFTAIAVGAGVMLVYLSFGKLFTIRSLAMILVGVLAVLAAIFYTIGKKPYGYRGFGDLAVFIFFGIVAVAGTFFLLTETLPATVFLPAASVGFMITGVVNLNNIRDIENDRKYRKTIPILIGERNAKHYHTALVFLPFMLMMIYNSLLYRTSFISHFFLILWYPFVLHHVFFVYQHQGLMLNKALGRLILITMLFVLSAI